MADNKKAPPQRKPTGQEMDKDYDELHQAADGLVPDDEHPRPGDGQAAGGQTRAEYMEEADLNDPD